MFALWFESKAKLDQPKTIQLYETGAATCRSWTMKQGKVIVMYNPISHMMIR